MLRYDDILAIHERVVSDFADDADPVGLSGPREEGRLLESVVGRQTVGLGNVLKYPDPYSNAATLTFGLCCGHPFHNGNKRTALVSMIAHLDQNNLTIFGMAQRPLYSMIKSVATHTLGVRADPRKKGKGYTERDADDEVAAIAEWLKAHARKIERGERPITYRQLRQILGRFGYTMEQPKNMMVGLYREQEVKRGLFRKTTPVKKKIMSFAYPGDGQVVGRNLLKQIRRTASLDEANGCDTAAFYDGADVVDAFINEYRSVLSKLARQ